MRQNGAETRLDEPASGQNASIVPGGRRIGAAAMKLLISDFYDHVREGRKFGIDGTEGIKTLRMISELYRSSQTRRSR